MIPFIKLFQNPYIKIFFSPFAFIAIGTILGHNHTQSPQWLSIVLLTILMITTQLIDHYLHLIKIQGKRNETPLAILIICEIIVTVATIIFLLTNNWLINLLLIIYLAFVHLQYYPFLIVNTFYQYLMMVVFYGISLNSIAFYSLTNNLTSVFLMQLIPFFVITAGLTIEINHLKYFRLTKKELSGLYHWTAIVLAFTAIGLGLLFALPTHSYYIAEILFVLGSGFCLVPIIVPVTNQKNRQNKINYLSSALVFFALFYSVALLF